MVVSTYTKCFVFAMLLSVEKLSPLRNRILLRKRENTVKMVLTFQRAVVAFTNMPSKFTIMLYFPGVLQMFDGVIVHTLVILFSSRDG